MAKEVMSGQGETNLGNLVADVLRQAVGADIGMNNGQGDQGFSRSW